jgi:hypothetical protein
MATNYTQTRTKQGPKCRVGRQQIYHALDNVQHNTDITDMFIHVTLTRAASHFTRLHESFLEKDIHAWRHHLQSSIPAVVGGEGREEVFNGW